MSLAFKKVEMNREVKGQILSYQTFYIFTAL